MDEKYPIDQPLLYKLTELARKDPDFDLFYRRFTMADRMLHLTPEQFQTLPSQPWYREFWTLVGEHKRATKFSEQEKSFRDQTMTLLGQETNPIKRQCFALTMLIFGDLQSSVINQQLWTKKLADDFAKFMAWNSVVDDQTPSSEFERSNDQSNSPSEKPDDKIVIGESERTIIIPTDQPIISPIVTQSDDRSNSQSNNRTDDRLQAMLAHNQEIQTILRSKYSALIKKYADVDWDSKQFEPVDGYKVFFCWLQGKRAMPPLIQCCYNSVAENVGARELVFVDEKNYSDLVDLPEYVLDKYRARKISRTHFSDILRLNLLERYGGLWLDATTLVTEPLDHHEDFWQRTYFTQKYCNEKDNPYARQFQCFVSYARWAGFIQGSSIKHHPLFVFGTEFLDEYWRDFDVLLDYVLIDYVMDIAYDNIPFVRREQDAVPINNLDINTLVFHLNDPYEKYPYDKLLKDTFLHKLSWKAPLNLQANGTVFKEIYQRYGARRQN